MIAYIESINSMLPGFRENILTIDGVVVRRIARANKTLTARALAGDIRELTSEAKRRGAADARCVRQVDWLFGWLCAVRP